MHQPSFSRRTRQVFRNVAGEFATLGIDVQSVVEAKLCRQRRNGWAMSVARVGLDAISTSLQLGFPTSHVGCEQVNQNLARSCQIQVEISEKNVGCENEMELLGFPKILNAGG